uniref:Uncharacterized protein n=1 Tax=Trypanosoma vivax (strain Y486) TaxID=1055687 RepID=G0U5Y7_TRYVY|nr:hypothetical protein TVY486_1003410 [Trypanosoma vivax Y486]
MNSLVCCCCCRLLTGDKKKKKKKNPREKGGRKKRSEAERGRTSWRILFALLLTPKVHLIRSSHTHTLPRHFFPYLQVPMPVTAHLLHLACFLPHLHSAATCAHSVSNFFFSFAATARDVSHQV